MLSSVSGAAFNNRRQGHDTLGKNYAERASKGLSFRVFKGPSLSTYQPVATAKFDFGYHAIPANDPRQNQQNWYLPRTHDMTTASALREMPKASRNRGNDTSSRNRVHDVNLRNLPSSYSIYQSASKNTYIYERSLSSKSDIYSDYDDSASTTTVSPAMSTDSLMTLKSPATSRPTTPNPANSYYAPHASMSGKPQPMPRENSFNHDPPHVSMSDAGGDMPLRGRNVSSSGRPTTPASSSFNSTARSSTPSPPVSQSVPRPVPGRIPSVISEEDELERISKINTAYNARTSSFFSTSLSRSPESANLPNAHPYSAPSAPPQPSSADIYSSAPKPSVIDSSSRRGLSVSGAGVEHASYPLYQPAVESPVENSRKSSVPAQVYAYRNDHRDPGQSDDFIPSLANKYEEPGLPEARPLHRFESSGYSGIPQILNEGHPEEETPESRARSPSLYHEQRPTRQMPSPEKVMATEHKQDRPLPIPPRLASQTSYHRERKASFSRYPNDVQGFVASENIKSTSGFIPSIVETDGTEPTSGNVNRSPVGQRPMPPSNYSSRQVDAQRGIAENVSTSFLANAVEGDATSPTRTHHLPSAKAQNNMAPIYEARNPHELELPSLKPSRSGVESYYTPSNVPFPSTSPTEEKSLPDPGLFVPSQHTSMPRTSTSERVAEPKTALNVPHFAEMEPLPRSGATGTSRSNIYAQDHGKGQPEPASKSSRRTTSGYVTDTEGQSLHRKGSLLQPQVTYTSSTHSGILLNPNAPKSSARPAFSVSIAEKPPVVTTQRSPTESRSRTSSSSSRRPAHEPHRRRSDGDQPLDGGPVSSQTAIAAHAIPTAPHSAASTHRMTTHPSASTSEPQRRYSDGDRVALPPEVPSGRNSAPLSRSVRWNENLVCPSPIFPSRRRKGWFNRRGDQLWTNDGAYKPAPSTQEYPPDLDGYPEYGQGWMNEEGVRIDMGHHLIPKAPLRSALKQSRT